MIASSVMSAQIGRYSRASRQSHINVNSKTLLMRGAREIRRRCKDVPAVTRTRSVLSALSVVVVVVVVVSIVAVFIVVVASAQELAVAFGDNNPDVVRREYVEYDPAPYGAHRRRPARPPGPFDGVVPGMAVLASASWLLWWNEGRHVRDARMLRRAERSVVSLLFAGDQDGVDDNGGGGGGGGRSKDENKEKEEWVNQKSVGSAGGVRGIDPSNEGKLVHISGTLRTDGVVDATFGLERPNALRLRRDTHAFQWLEEKSETRSRIDEHRSRVTITYRYRRDWAKKKVDSGRFESSAGHDNPAALRFDPGVEYWTVDDATLPNGLRVHPELLNAGLGEFRPVRLGGGFEGGTILPPFGNAVIFGSRVYIPNDETTQIGDLEAAPTDEFRSKRNMSNGSVSSTSSSAKSMVVSRGVPHPSIGDIRIEWSEVPMPRRGVSVLAKQEGDKLVRWTDVSTGHGIYALVEGTVPAQDMIRDLREISRKQTWILRAVGWAGTYLGFKWVLSCLPYIAGRVPLYIGKLLEPIADLATTFVAAGGSIGLSSAVISIAWLRFRPELAVAFAALSTAAFYTPLLYSRWKQTSKHTEAFVLNSDIDYYDTQKPPDIIDST